MQDVWVFFIIIYEHTISLQSNFRICTSSTAAFPWGKRGFAISLKT